MAEVEVAAGVAVGAMTGRGSLGPIGMLLSLFARGYLMYVNRSETQFRLV